jgi:hypothetical protein
MESNLSFPRRKAEEKKPGGRRRRESEKKSPWKLWIEDESNLIILDKMSVSVPLCSSLK